jgi:isoquinoline 1-oxidoreductase alpha subunit
MIELTINKQSQTLDIEEDTPLLWVLRDELHMTGTKFGCGIAQCGACTVWIDGQATRSCVLPIGALEGKQIETIEGIEGKEINALRDAWTELGVPQCGYCQSGQLMQASDLLKRNPSPSDDDIESAMMGNICRCGTYLKIKKGIRLAAQRLQA